MYVVELSATAGPAAGSMRARSAGSMYGSARPVPFPAAPVADDSRIGVIWDGEYYYFSTGHGEDLDSDYPPPAYRSRGDIKTTALRGDALRHVT
jgi:hypothetical protein